MVLMLSVRLAATIHKLLRTYAPANILVDRLRTRRGLKWAFPVALMLVPTYLFAAAITTTDIADGGPGWLNLVVLLFIWNAMKCAVMGVLTPWLLLRQCWSEHHENRSNAIGATSVMVNSGRA